MTKRITRINGFTITQHLIGHEDTYYVAYRKGFSVDDFVNENYNNNDKVFTAKRLSALENKVKHCRQLVEKPSICPYSLIGKTFPTLACWCS